MESRFLSVVPVSRSGEQIPISFAVFAVPRSRTPALRYPVRYAARAIERTLPWTFAR